MNGEWDHKVLEVNGGDFERVALSVFRFQAAENPVYRSYLEALQVDPSGISVLTQVPFLPARFFKTHPVKTTAFEPALVFESSGTTGSINSRHFVKDPALYKASFTNCFELFYGPVTNYCIIGLLPSYLERKNASLVFMLQELVKLSGHPQSGFYLDEQEQLAAVLDELEWKGQKTLLAGVTFALLDFAEKYPRLLKSTLVMETGGMKGRRKEMIRAEVHQLLKDAFGVPSVHSEYGMTELLSQAYAKGEGLFCCPPWMKVLIRNEEDPFQVSTSGSGTINIIDLANVYSCSFIATDDAGRLNTDGTFEVLGRVDGSDLRGCSLMLV